MLLPPLRRLRGAARSRNVSRTTCALLVGLAAPAAAQESRTLAPTTSPSAPAPSTPRYAGPSIDVHLHGVPAGPLGPTPPNPTSGRASPVRTGEDQRRLTLAAMAERGVVLGVASVDPTAPSGKADRAAWVAEGGARVLLGANGFGGLPRTPLPTLAALRAAHHAGRLQLIGEIGAEYSGMALDDPRLEPYYALAEELDVPVGVLTGGGPPGTALRGSPGFRIALGRPLALEDVLVRHPELRVFVMHAGGAFVEETLALLQQYPNVYADVSALDRVAPRAQFHDIVRALTHAGFGDRLMFGTDGGAWLDAIGLAVDGVDSAPFLTAEEKRAIFFDNAARFLRLDSARVRIPTAGTGRPSRRWPCLSEHRRLPRAGPAVK